jgi:hypothetical protein
MPNSKTQAGPEEFADSPPLPMRPVGLRWRSGIDMERNDRGLSDLPGRSERALQRRDFGLQHLRGGGPLLCFALAVGGWRPCPAPRSRKCLIGSTPGGRAGLFARQ